MPQKLTVQDSTALKLAMLAVLEAYGRYSKPQLDQIASAVSTPYMPGAEAMTNMARIQIDGKPLVKVRQESVGPKKERFFESTFLLEGHTYPGGWRTVSKALCIRMCELLGTPVPEDEREEDNAENAEIREAATRLAASIEMESEVPQVH